MNPNDTTRHLDNALMKRSTSRPSIVAAACLIATLCLAITAHAQNYAIDWYKIAGGGGTCTGSVYSISGTIGQHDAGGPMTGGGYSITGGFWSLFAVQTAGAPILRIALTPTNTAMVYWPSAFTNFNVQVKSNLASALWSPATETIQDNGTNKFIIVNPPTGTRFYRLVSP
jgi:hypothetical protein